MNEFDTTIVNAAILAIVALGGLLLAAILNWLLRRRQRRKPVEIGGFPVRFEMLGAPLRALFPGFAMRLALEVGLSFPESISSPLAHILDIWIIGSLAWLAKRAVEMIRQAVIARYPIDVEDNLEARRVRTQTRIFARVLNVAIIVLGIALILMTFPGVREFGTALLVSAGFGAIAVGMAAQSSLGSIFAGIQIALTQPIRLDDVVIVEGEWGRVEEITLTYVVVRIWDQRRLVVPISYFIENSVENWTRSNAEILGTVFMYADYTIPVGQIRSKLKELLDDTPLWDGRAWGVVVTDTTERTVEIRALMSAEDSSKAWDLRCHIRERLLEFLQKEFPQSLPRLRLEGEPLSG
ncbi:MAG: mechanosensitive ion channel family protein [Anaerolineales bacterium]